MKKHVLDNLMLHLNSISRIAAIENATQTQKYIQQVTNIIRYKASREGQILTVSEELKAVENFLNVYKMRLGDLFFYELAVDEDSLVCYIPHYTMMCFVENVLFHAFVSKEEVMRLKIIIKKTADLLVIEINDNGCGFEPEALLANRTSDLQYGTIPWVFRRLTSQYPITAPIDIKSIKEKGTSVIISLPL